VADLTGARIVQSNDIPNANWLRPGTVSRGRQQFGDGLLAAHPIVVLPSVVSTNSWNLILTPAAAGRCQVLGQEPFALDTRLAAKP
jgi:RES domain-containing protein